MNAVFSCRWTIVFQRNGITSRTFLITKYYRNCLGGNADYGWMMVVDVYNKWKPCVYDKHLTYPVFLYVNGSTAAALLPSGIFFRRKLPMRLLCEHIKKWWSTFHPITLNMNNAFSMLQTLQTQKKPQLDMKEI